MSLGASKYADFSCRSLCALAFTVRPPSGHDQKTRFYASESSLPSLVHTLTMPNRWSGPKRPMALTCFGLVSPPRCESTAVHCWPEHMRARLKITISRLESPQGHHRTSSSQASSRAEASPRCTGSRAVTVPIPLPETDPGAGKGLMRTWALFLKTSLDSATDEQFGSLGLFSPEQYSLHPV